MHRSRKLRFRWWNSFLVFCFILSTAAPTAFAEQTDSVPQADQTGVPSILITEIVTMTVGATNGGSTNDAFEYVEIYNNTDQPIDFSNYKVLYRYPTTPDEDLILSPYPSDVVIEPGRTLILWGQNSANVNETVASFNAHFGTNLIENRDIVKIDLGLHSSRTRWIVIATNSGHEIVSAAYNDGVTDSSRDQGILYRYPADGSIEMIKYSSKEKPATPGAVEDGQVPDTLNSVPEDAVPPVIRNETSPEAAPAMPVEIVAQVQDNLLVTAVHLHYRTDPEASFTDVPLRIDREDGRYRHEISVMDMVGKPSVEYYFTASDGSHLTTTDVYTVQVKRSDASPRLNVSSGDILSGTQRIAAASNTDAPDRVQLLIDGLEAPTSYLGLEDPAFFIFEAHGMDNVFKNTVSRDGETLQLIDYRIYDFQDVIIPVEGIRSGSNTITVSAGSQVAPYAGRPHENLDDFDIRNVRLLLADGTVLRDPQYSDPTQLLDMGDNGRYFPVADFTFTVPEEKASAKLLDLDTSALPDGVHQIEAVTPDGSRASASVTVDNYGPVLDTSLADGQRYKGPFTIDASARDEHTGVSHLAAELDGEAIELPYSTSSAALESGEHELVLRAEDQAGNLSERVVRFSTAAEHPTVTNDVYPSDGAAGVDLNPTLAAHVADPDADPLQVTFYEGQTYNAQRPGTVTWYAGASETEPPATPVPAGERMLTDEEIASLASVDGEFVTVDAVTEFPYLRMEVEMDPGLKPNDEIRIHWEGRSLPGRKVTMYVWNVSAQQWTPLDRHIAQSEETFALEGFVAAGDALQGRTLNVLIQDELVLDDDYDYTIAWITDTQYYTQTLSHVMQAQVDWIAENKEALNIQYLFHTGDLVENAHQEYQWAVADRLMGELEATGIPNGVLAGNHDVLPGNDYAMYSKYFGAFRYEDRPYYGGSYKDNRGHYDLVSIGGTDYIMVYMGWGEGEEEVEWLNEVLAEYPDRKAILAVHDYVTAAGQRSTTGNYLFERVVVPNPNVFMVLSGHYTGAALKTDTLDDNGDGAADRTVYQLLSDYQGIGEGGDGYIKLLHVDSDSGAIHVRTYSPYKDDYNYYEPEQYPTADEYTIYPDIQPQVKRVATDYAAVYAYTSNAIGGTIQIPSGETAQIQWSRLQPDRTYSWYVEARDDFGGRTVSDMFSFRTAEAGIPSDPDLAALQAQLAAYIASEEVTQPLASQLTNLLNNAERHFTNGKMAQAVQQLENFLQHLSNPALQDSVTPEAKAALVQAAGARIADWS